MIVPVDKIQKFKLNEAFLEEYKEVEPNWGFGLLSYITFKRTYARPVKGEDRTEEWWELCKRVVEGTFTIQKAHINSMNLHWDNRKAQRSAQKMYDAIFNFKFLPPGRGLWMMGTDFVYEHGGAGLNNCAFKSTENIRTDLAYPFVWNFLMSMYGVGVGFDTRGADTVTIREPRRAEEAHVVGDSREGWAEAIERCLTAFSGKGSLPSEWDFSEVRPAGTPIRGFGGTASGPAPLEKALERIENLLLGYVGEKLDEAGIVDIMNICGACVVAGGARRTAQIAFGTSEQFMDLKLDTEKLMEWRWASNNSIFAELGMDYNPPASRTAQNGEPGYAWLYNMRNYGRMKDGFNPDADPRVSGGNPCLEQSLEDCELCCLVESFPAHHDSLEDYKTTLKMAYLYAKTVTLVPTHDPHTNAVMLRNRRIGCSMSGIAQNIEKIGLAEHLRWADEGYEEISRLDRVYSEWMCIPESIKKTSVKPSGTVSILAGATPGIHYGHSEYYIRRIRVSDSSPIWKNCEAAGYKVEDDVYSDATKVIEFPIHDPLSKRSKDDLSIWEQVSLAALMQEYWADNQVSCTVNFDEKDADQIANVLSHFQHKLKGISFLPNAHGYAQPPYEKITREEYESVMDRIDKNFDFRQVDIEGDLEDKFCDGEACEISWD